MSLYASNGSSEEVVVPKHYACQWSPILKWAFNSKKKPTSIYRCPNCGDRTVDLLGGWLYEQKLVIAKDHDRKKEEDMALVELWVLAEKLRMPQLQNDVIRKIEHIAKATKKVNTKCFSFVYANTVPESPLRRLFLAHCAYHLRPGAFADSSDDYPKEMLIELATLYSSSFPKREKDREGLERDINDYLVWDESSGVVATD